MKKTSKRLLAPFIFCAIMLALLARLFLGIDGISEREGDIWQRLLDVVLLAILFPAILIVTSLGLFSLPARRAIKRLRSQTNAAGVYWVGIDQESLDSFSRLTGSAVKQSFGNFIVARLDDRLSFYRGSHATKRPFFSLEIQEVSIRRDFVQSYVSKVPAVQVSFQSEKILLYVLDEKRWWWFKRANAEDVQRAVTSLSSDPQRSRGHA